jgi:hypothetical protein
MGTNENLIKTGTIHELKIWTVHMEDLDCGRKTFEARSTKDRTFNIGDILFLNEYDPDQRVYSGRQLRALVLGVHTGIGVAPGFAILSLADLDRTGRQWINESERVGRAEDSLTSHITQADLDAVAPIFFPKLPGSEGLAGKVQEIQSAALTKTAGFAPPPGMTDPATIRFGTDGNQACVWVSRKKILEQLRIRELLPWSRVLTDKTAWLTIQEITEIIMQRRGIRLESAEMIAKDIAEASKAKASKEKL